MEIQWKPYLWDEPRPVDPSEFERFERDWGVVLPAEYKRLAARYQGMSPTPSAFDVGHVQDAVCTLLTVHVEEGLEPYAIRDCLEVTRPYVPDGIYPFGNTPGGEFLCFDYRGASKEPKVVLVSVEMDVHPVADSFREFLEGLHPEHVAWA